MTNRDDTARRLSLYWGVTPLRTDIGEAVDAASTLIGQQLVASGLVGAGAEVVFVSINADLSRRDANYLKIQRV
jgi:pyruvate kinase